MDSFVMNGYPWHIRIIDPGSPLLVDRTGRLTVAVTDPNVLTVYISANLREPFLSRVLVHELGHCALFSYGLLDDIRSMVHPSRWVDVEEWVCNFIADYGWQIFQIANDWRYIPYELERLIA